jgi:hypothetical protein
VDSFGSNAEHSFLSHFLGARPLAHIARDRRRDGRFNFRGQGVFAVGGCVRHPTRFRTDGGALVAWKTIASRSRAIAGARYAPRLFALPGSAACSRPSRGTPLSLRQFLQEFVRALSCGDTRRPEPRFLMWTRKLARVISSGHRCAVFCRVSFHATLPLRKASVQPFLDVGRPASSAQREFDTRSQARHTLAGC